MWLKSLNYTWTICITPGNNHILFSNLWHKAHYNCDALINVWHLKFQTLNFFTFYQFFFVHITCLEISLESRNPMQMWSAPQAMLWCHKTTGGQYHYSINCWPPKVVLLDSGGHTPLWKKLEMWHLREDSNVSEKQASFSCFTSIKVILTNLKLGDS